MRISPTTRALLGIALLLGLAPVAGAATWRPIPDWQGGTLQTDGDRYVLHERDGALTVRADATGAVQRPAIPPGCWNGARLGTAAIGFLCREGAPLRVYDLATARWSDVPRPDDRVAGGQQAASVVVGREWIRVSGALDCCFDGDWKQYVRRATGDMGPEDPQTPDVREDLDDARLWVPLCEPLRRPRDPRYSPVDHRSDRFEEPIMDGPWQVVAGRGHHTWLSRCGGRRELLTRSPHARGFEIGGGLVTWVQRDDGRKTRGHAVVHSIATGRRRRWRIPGPPAWFPSVSHTRRRVFASRSEGRGHRVRRWSIILRP